MNTDERGYFDALMTERVLGAVFEVSNNCVGGDSLRGGKGRESEN